MVSLELEARLDNLLATAQEETAYIDLFAPIKAREECPICMIPLPLGEDETIFEICCGQRICAGCIWKNIQTDRKNGVPDHEQKCAFCRQAPKSTIKALKKLMKKNNSEAYMQMGLAYKSGEVSSAGGSEDVFQSDTRALEMYISAAELGHIGALEHIGSKYLLGDIAVEQWNSKALAFYEVAAKKGSVHAHVVLSSFHDKMGNTSECIKHVSVTAGAGNKESMDVFMKAYKDNLVSKEDLAQTLRAFQVSNDLMKSKERDDARAFYEEHGIA